MCTSRAPSAGCSSTRIPATRRTGPTCGIGRSAPPGMSPQGVLTPGEWVIRPGSSPDPSQTRVLPGDLFVADYTYEWQVRTYDLVGGPASEWSDSFRFHAIETPGSESGPLPVSAATRPQGSLGCGEYRVFLYQQGGQIRLGEITPIDRMNFTRVRDDISNCIVFSSGYSVDCGALYATMRSWMHELVVFRDGVRVWEGPITRIGYSVDSVEIEAKDVMAYVYRRVMRAGYNDAYRLIQAGTGGLPDQYLGLLSVVKRAAMLITQALAPYDPNVLPYLTAIEYPDDAKESRVVADWSRSAWEEVDDLAATAGLDYTTVGRRILLWDTHRAIGRLPEMRDGDFSDSPIVTEYGMQLATLFAVTNGSGVVGVAEVPAGPASVRPDRAVGICLQRLGGSGLGCADPGGAGGSPGGDDGAGEAQHLGSLARSAGGAHPGQLHAVPERQCRLPAAHPGGLAAVAVGPDAPRGAAVAEAGLDRGGDRREG